MSREGERCGNCRNFRDDLGGSVCALNPPTCIRFNDIRGYNDRVIGLEPVWRQPGVTENGWCSHWAPEGVPS